MLSIIRIGFPGLFSIFLSENDGWKICPDEKMSWNPDNPTGRYLSS